MNRHTKASVLVLASVLVCCSGQMCGSGGSPGSGGSSGSSPAGGDNGGPGPVDLQRPGVFITVWDDLYAADSGEDQSRYEALIESVCSIGVDRVYVDAFSLSTFATATGFSHVEELDDVVAPGDDLPTVAEQQGRRISLSELIPPASSRSIQVYAVVNTHVAFVSNAAEVPDGVPKKAKEVLVGIPTDNEQNEHFAMVKSVVEGLCRVPGLKGILLDRARFVDDPDLILPQIKDAVEERFPPGKHGDTLPRVEAVTGFVAAMGSVCRAYGKELWVTPWAQDGVFDASGLTSGQRDIGQDYERLCEHTGRLLIMAYTGDPQHGTADKDGAHKFLSDVARFALEETAGADCTVDLILQVYRRGDDETLDAPGPDWIGGEDGELTVVANQGVSEVSFFAWNSLSGEEKRVISDRFGDCGEQPSTDTSGEDEPTNGDGGGGTPHGGGTLTLVAEYVIAGGVSDIAIDGHRAYARTSDGTVFLLDVNDPANPVELGLIPSSIRGSVSAEDGIAYVGLGLGITAYDVVNPASPTELGSLSFSGLVGRFVVRDHYVYALVEDSGLHILGFREPTSPLQLGVVDIPVDWVLWTSMHVAGSFVYVARTAIELPPRGELLVIEISDPASPAHVGTFADLQWAYGVSAEGGYAYVADYSEGLKILDVDMPSRPSLAGHYDEGYSVYQDVVVEDGLAYIADSFDVRVLDVSDVDTPFERASYNLWPGGDLGPFSYTERIAVREGLVYAATGEGLLILRFSEE